MAARKPKAAPAAPNPLLEQLKFVATILNKKGEPNETCCVISNGAITASNSPLSVGILTEASLTASPPAWQLIAALERCKDGYAMSELRGVISLASGPLRVNLPTVEGLAPSQPDNWLAPLSAELFDAVAAIQHVADEDAEFIEATCICLSDGLASAVNETRSIIMQVYHGISMPTMMVPVRFFKRLAQCGKVPTGFGFTADRSLTVYFDDNSWLRTALGACAPLPYSKVLDGGSSFAAMPDIWEPLETIMPFRGNTAAVTLSVGMVKTATASHDAPWTTDCILINADYLKQAKPFCEHFAIDNGKFYFYKGNVRGVIALMD